MNKSIIACIIVLFCVFTWSGSAQDFKGGVLGGLAATEVSGDRLEGPHKAGIYAGVFVNRQFTPKSSMQMELDFIQKGSRENPDSANAYQSYLLRLNYIEMPVHYRFHFHEKAALEAGLSLGVLLNSYEEANGSEDVSATAFNSTDLSINIGAFYEFIEHFKINVRYSNSILAIRPHPNDQTYRWNHGQYNEVLSFVIFYEF
ncbi:MAG: porin family protein [Bacteroidales bacterium]